MFAVLVAMLLVLVEMLDVFVEMFEVFVEILDVLVAMLVAFVVTSPETSRMSAALIAPVSATLLVMDATSPDTDIRSS